MDKRCKSKESIEIQSVVPEKPAKVAKKVKKLILKEKDTSEVDKEESTKVNLKIISEGLKENYSMVSAIVRCSNKSICVLSFLIADNKYGSISFAIAFANGNTTEFPN